MEKLERERKFLIQIPLKWYGKFKVLLSPFVRIYQVYLKESGIENSRIRATVSYTIDGQSKVNYTYTKKTFISPGVNKEYEISLSSHEYYDKLKLKDHSKFRIEKTRYNICYASQDFEFDIYQDNLLGLGILEREFKESEYFNMRVMLPPFLICVKEVTNDKRYSNANLAKLSSIKEIGNSNSK